jgi:acyl-CoA reductase-like NAD-dependent aldehyde dehydrogenase
VKAAEELEQMTARWAQMPWQERQGYLISFIDSIPDHELAQAFLMCNYFYNSPPQKKFIKFKKAFVLVRWLKKPSEYDRESISNTMGWYPLVWLKEMK